MIADAATPHHIPVLLDGVLQALAPKAGETYVDGTLGAGGYTRAILAQAECRVIGIDRDPNVIADAARWSGDYEGRLTVLKGCFGDAGTLLEQAEIGKVDGFVLDLGVSSMQIDQAERGFSFRFDGPLDMRMDPHSGQSAADLVNTASEQEIADILWIYGEERHSRRIARAIGAARLKARIETTLQLADIVRSVLPRNPRDLSDPSTRTFQALRIAVNDELGELDRALEAAEHILRPGGRLVVVTFHSLEDRKVKQFLVERSGAAPRGSRHLPETGAAAPLPTFHVSARKPVLPDEAEMRANPRSRSAKLRWAVRTDAPAHMDGRAA